MDKPYSIPSQPCPHAEDFMQLSTSTEPIKLPPDQLFFGSQWKHAILSATGVDVVHKIIRYFKSLSTFELKLSPIHHPSVLIASSATNVEPTESHLHQNPTDTQVRYLLVMAEIIVLRDTMRCALDEQANGDWWKAAQSWDLANSRLYFMHRYMKSWLEIYERYCGDDRKGPIEMLDDLLPDGHDYKVLEGFWPEIKQIIIDTYKGRQECAGKLNNHFDVVEESGDQQCSLVPWHLVKPVGADNMCYGEHWYYYIQQSTNSVVLREFIQVCNICIVQFDNDPISFPPPVQCAECYPNIRTYLNTSLGDNESTHVGFIGQSKADSVFLPKYLQALALLKSLVFLQNDLNEFMLEHRVKREQVLLFPELKKRIEEFRRKYSTWYDLLKHATCETHERVLAAKETYWIVQEIVSGVEDIASSLGLNSLLSGQSLNGKSNLHNMMKLNSFFASNSKNLKGRSGGETNEQKATLAVDRAADSIFGATGVAAKLDNNSVNSNVEAAASSASTGRGKQVEPAPDAKIAADGSIVDPFPRVPCSHSRIYMNPTSVVARKRTNGLYFGDQWADLLSDKKLLLAVMHRAIRYFESLSVDELKLPPSLHPREVISAKVAAVACLPPSEGRPLTEQLARTQSRYILAHLQLTKLNCEYLMTVQWQSKKDWAKALQSWNYSNDRLFLMSKYMKQWEQIYLKHTSQRAASDSLSSAVVLEDGHDYKTLERLWPKIEGCIQRMKVGLKVCALKVGDKEWCAFLDAHQSNNDSCVTWSVLRRTTLLVYGRNWYNYIYQCDDFLTLSSLTTFFESFAGFQNRLPPFIPPPVQCSLCFSNYSGYFSTDDIALFNSRGDEFHESYDGQLIIDSRLRSHHLRVYAGLRTYSLAASTYAIWRQVDGADEIDKWFREGVISLGNAIIPWSELISEADSDDHPLLTAADEDFDILTDICAKYKELFEAFVKVTNSEPDARPEAKAVTNEANAESGTKSSDSLLIPASTLKSNPVTESKKRKKKKGTKNKTVTSDAVSGDGDVLLTDCCQQTDSKSTAQQDSNATCSDLAESLDDADCYGKLANDSTASPSTSAQPASVMESPSYQHHASVDVSSAPLRQCNSPIVLGPVTDSKNIGMKSSGETNQQEASLAVDSSAVDSIVGAKGPAAKLNNISVNSNVDAASLVSAGRGKQAKANPDAKIAAENLPSGSIAGAVPRVPCAHSNDYMKLTFVATRKRVKGVYFGNQWAFLTSQELSLVVIRKAIRYFESLSVDELKLPPSLHPREVTSAKVATACLPLEGRPLAEQPAYTQSRYLLAHFQLATLHCEYTMTVQRQSKKDWANALQSWNNSNDRLFLMSKYMKQWEQIYLKHTSQRTASDSLSSPIVLKDGHDYKALERLLSDVETFIQRMMVGMKVCALKVGDRELCAFLDAHQSNNDSCVTWGVLRRPKSLAYGQNWYNYIYQCDDFNTLIDLTNFFESFFGFQNRIPPLMPPPVQCSKCFCNYDGYFSNDSASIFQDEEFLGSYDGQLFLDSQLQSHHLPVYARLRIYSLAASTYTIWKQVARADELDKWFREGVIGLRKVISPWAQLISEADSDDHPLLAAAEEEFDILQDIVLKYNELYETFVKVTSEPNVILDAKAGKSTDEANAESGTKSSESLLTPSSILNDNLDTQSKKRKKRNNKKKAVTTSDGVTDDVTLLADGSQLPCSNSTAPQHFDGASSVSANDFSTAVIALESLDLSPEVSRLPNQVRDGAVAETLVGAVCDGKAGSDGVESVSVLEPLSSYKKHSSVAVSSSLLRQYECPICLEHLACAVTLLPCGDNFCYACIADYMNKSKTKRCPNCQSDQVNLTNTVPNRLAENTVQEILVQLGAEGEEQLTSWRRRADAGLEGRKRDIEAAAAAAACVGGHGGKKKKNKKK